jgi:hypothetical protein
LPHYNVPEDLRQIILTEEELLYYAPVLAEVCHVFGFVKNCIAFDSDQAINHTKKKDFQFNFKSICLLSFAHFSILSPSLDLCKVFKFYVFMLFDFFSGSPASLAI